MSIKKMEKKNLGNYLISYHALTLEHQDFGLIFSY